MADIEGLIPHIIKWEAGTIQKPKETASSLFERARLKGFANDPQDKGGATMIGVTLATYKAYCKAYHISEPTVDNLKHIPYSTWKNILKVYYWDKYKADQIQNQSLANMCVDYVWGSGKYGISKVQKALGLVADGIVGAKTLAMLNGMNAYNMFSIVKQVRINHYNAIVKASPSQKKWLKGWLNRVNDIKFYS